MVRNNTILSQIQRFFAIVVSVSIVIELLWFPSLVNLWGCIMTALAFLVFSSIINKSDVIALHPFSSLAYFQMFLAHVIPLPATLLEGHPISFGFEFGEKTFIGESLMFLTCSAAFFCSVKSNSINRNTIISRVLYRFGMFSFDKRSLWLMGFIGTFANLYSMVNRFVTEYGDVGGKFIAGLTYLQYAPVIMMFPSLVGLVVSKREKRYILFYVISIFVLSLLSNSRQAMIYPVFTLVLLFFLCMVKEKSNLHNYFSRTGLILSIIGAVFLITLFSSLSDAMLQTRNLKKEVGRSELFVKTLDAFLGADDTRPLHENSYPMDKKAIHSYSSGWTETYIDNFMLNRFGNMRVSDETQYYADIVQKNNKDGMMRVTLLKRIFYIFPTPLLRLLSINLNKTEVEYSPGDYLYLIGSGTKRFALGGYRVTTLVGDGMANFGYYCFPIIFILLYISFRLLDTLVYFKNNEPLYGAIGLICVFGYFGCFRNSIGCINIISFIIRAFWQRCFTFLSLLFLIRFALYRRFVR